LFIHPHCNWTVVSRSEAIQSTQKIFFCTSDMQYLFTPPCFKQKANSAAPNPGLFSAYGEEEEVRATELALMWIQIQRLLRSLEASRRLFHAVASI
jgi:hypothetical protein